MMPNCVVHLDLKGAPWKMGYLQQVIQFIKFHGGSGVLLEWEDTFPYTSQLVSIGSLGGCSRDGLYTPEEVTHIIQYVKTCGMEPIQLVQTLGHMEFVLKQGPFKRLREVARSPAVLCPTRPGAKALVQSMISQVMQAQPDAAYLHIGADEAWHLNECAECQVRTRLADHGPISLFMEHIQTVASFIKARYPNVKVLMWDDMIRNVGVEILKGYNLGNLVVPVVWNYNVEGKFNMDAQMWERYFYTFKNPWVASAFKGASSSCEMVCSLPRYASNQVAWQEELKVYKENINFGGIILTGWSRFDHYATLCELLPVAMPCLATCLWMWTRADGFTNAQYIQDPVPLEQCPGGALARNIISAHQVRNSVLSYLHGDQVMTWMNEWQVEHDYTSPLQMESIAAVSKQLMDELNMCRRELSTALHALTGRRSAEEWLQTFLAPPFKRIAGLHARAEARRLGPAGITPTADRRRTSQ